MKNSSSSIGKSVDPNHAFEIAPGIYWVGYYLPDDPFQCHTYLIENGDQSVLIDPGSKLTFAHTLGKIEEVTSFHNIRYFLCHHQDPDITGALPLIDQLIHRDDAVLVSHWRALALIKHYGLRLPTWCVEEHGWTLDLGKRYLRFIFTPYLHFSGAFCSFEEKSAVLFSSDLFGGYTQGFNLFARDESHFESMRTFHEHYMPSKEILYDGLLKLEKYPIRLIAPQHGAIIPKNLVRFMINQLKNLDCGLFRMTQVSTDVKRLSALNRMLQQFLRILVLRREFSEIAQSFKDYIRQILPVEKLEFFARNKEGITLHLAEESMYRGVQTKMPVECNDCLDLDQNQWRDRKKRDFLLLPGEKSKGEDQKQQIEVIIPLFSSDARGIYGFAKLVCGNELLMDEETGQLLMQISVPLSVAVEREIIQRTMELEKQKFYDQAIHDPLTGLYTRIYMNEAVNRLFHLHDRDERGLVAVIILDIDFFKSVNDLFGHNIGDLALKQVAGIIMHETRMGDIQVRLGGEEFAVFIVSPEQQTVLTIAERIRGKVMELKMEEPLSQCKLTISGGIAFRHQRENLADAIQRADRALYEAKNRGRNRIVAY